MSDMAKQARAAMKSKAKSLTGADLSQKVDSSTWTPPEPLNTTAKTGLRPISRRAFKKGGKVEGESCKANMGRTPRKSGGEVKNWVDAKVNRNVKDANEERPGTKHVGALKSGGRAKKMLGGPMIGDGMMVPAGGASAIPVSPALANAPMVSKDVLNFGTGARGSPYKKGGKVAHEDEKADIALIKKMVKPSARAARKEGGGVFTGPGYPGKIPGVTGGRKAHARGGRSKGKTNIHINIAAHKPDAMAGMGGMGDMGGPLGGPIKPPGMGGPAGGAPLPVGAMPPGMPPAVPPGMSAGMPPGMPAPPPGMRPMARKAGGRTYRSYKDMDAGAGSGEGRLEKSEIAERNRGARKAGGRTYRSYKDMDAGSGSGEGRLEKAEIQKHKK